MNLDRIKRFISKLKEELDKDNTIIVAAGVAFYFFLSLFPAIAAAVSIIALLNDPVDIQNQIKSVSHIIPERMIEFIIQRLKVVSNASGETLGWSTFLSLLLSVWTANIGTRALFKGISIAYNESNGRGFILQNAVTLLVTIGGMIMVVFSLALIVGFTALIGQFDIPHTLKTMLSWGRWVILAVMVKISIGLLYTYAPDRQQRFVWISWGSFTATVLWLIGSFGFSFYVENFGRFDEVYGSLSAVVILLLYFNLSFFIILFGAEINAVIEGNKE